MFREKSAEVTELHSVSVRLWKELSGARERLLSECRSSALQYGVAVRCSELSKAAAACTKTPGSGSPQGWSERAAQLLRLPSTEQHHISDLQDLIEQAFRLLRTLSQSNIILLNTTIKAPIYSEEIFTFRQYDFYSWPTHSLFQLLSFVYEMSTVVNLFPENMAL